VQVVARRGLRCHIHDFLIKNSPKRAVISVGHLASGRVRGKAAHRRHRSARVPPSGSSRRAADPTQATTNHIPLQEEQRATNIRRWPTWRAPLAYEGKLTSKASDCEQKPQIGGRPTAVGFVPEYGTWSADTDRGISWARPRHVRSQCTPCMHSARPLSAAAAEAMAQAHQADVQQAALVVQLPSVQGVAIGIEPLLGASFLKPPRRHLNRDGQRG
jgi:hypothetical protein